jgi:hypothetical protein
LKTVDNLPNVIRYSFRQPFAVSAHEAFAWCTDYTENDHTLMGHRNAKRQIQHIAKSTLIISDTFQTSAGPVEKQKLVELYPNQLAWNATHLTGPIRYSQFQYQIVPDGPDQSHLEFTGLVLDYGKDLKWAEIEALAEQLCSEDANTWQHLANAMAKDLSSKR